jgi:hypothetical protein
MYIAGSGSDSRSKHRDGGNENGNELHSGWSRAAMGVVMVEDVCVDGCGNAMRGTRASLYKLFTF